MRLGPVNLLKLGLNRRFPPADYQNCFFAKHVYETTSILLLVRQEQLKLKSPIRHNSVGSTRH